MARAESEKDTTEPPHPDEAEARDGTTRPHRFSFAALKAIVWRLFYSIGEEQLTLIAAGVSFYAMLALVPTLIALISIYGFVADPTDMQQLLALLKPLVPQLAYDLLQAQVESLAKKSDTTFKITSLGSVLVAIWTAKAGVNALLTGLNVANRERDDRSILRAMLLSYVLTLGLILVMSITLAAIVIIPAIFSFITEKSFGARLVLWLRWPIAYAAVVTSLGILYRLGPSRRGAKVRWLSPGALFTTAIWMLASAALSFYVSTFGDYQATYGALGAVVVLMLWFWISTLVVLIGARLNAEMEYQTRADTTTGPERPMGRRGAFVADNVPWDDQKNGDR